MKRVQAQELDSVADYELIEAALPSASPGNVVIKVHSCGMGYVDALVALGRYQVKPPVPFTPGQEISGVVESVGDGVTTLHPGDRVMASAFGGGLAEFVATPAAAVTKIPGAMTFAQAAGFSINYVTAMHALIDRAAIQPGERMLVFGAAGGVGAAAVQLGSLLGMEVIAAASSEEKRAFAASLGAKTTIDTEPDGWRDRLKSALGRKTLDVVFDPVCGPNFEAAFRSLSWRGRHLVIGFAGGPIPKLPVNFSLMKGASLVGVDVRQFFLYEGPRAMTHLGELMNHVQSGQLSPPIGRRFPLAQFAEAMEFATSGKGMAKTVIDIIPHADGL